MRVKENIILEFDEFSNDYTQDMIKCVPHYEQLVSGIVSFLPPDFKASNILDLGCGNGNLIELLIARYPDSLYTLVDASPEMLKICRERFPDTRLAFFEGYFDDYIFTADHFDLITASFSFHHINSREKESMFKKIYGALREGGIFCSSDLMIHKSNPAHPVLLEEWKEFVIGNHSDDEKWNWLMEHYNTFDQPDDLKDQLEWLQMAGFSTVHVPWNKGHWVTIQAIK